MKRRLKKLLELFKEKLSVSKRQQFVTVVAVLTLEMMATQLISGGLRLDVVIGLAISAYILSALVLRQDLKGWEYITLLVLPTLYTIAVFLFYFLLPTRWLTRLPIAFLYAVGMYAILLTENIYNVAAERNIQLLRAAHSVGFLLTLVTVFFLIDTLLSLHLPFYMNGLLAFVLMVPLVLQVLWAMVLTPTIPISVWLGTLVISFVLAQIVIIFSFWPIRITIESLFITTVFYSLVGMTQQFLVERLFSKTAREFLIVLVLVFLLVIFTTRWGVGSL